MELLITGAGSWLPEAGRETASFLIDGRHMVDTGWAPVFRLRECGVDPLAIETITFTHFHHDHYVGFPHLIFYHGMRRREAGITAPLRILGPPGNLDRIVRLTQEFLQWERFPELKFEISLEPLNPGERVQLGNLSMETIAAVHVSGKGDPEEALSLRFTPVGGGAALVLSGDTSYNPALAEFAAGARVLAHDAAHSGGEDAARIAASAGVEELYLAHYGLDRAEKLMAAARAVFPRTSLAVDGARITV